MKINKSQAIFKNLPNQYMTYRLKEDNRSTLVCKVTDWNLSNITDIYKDKIVKDIIRRINSFELSGGDTSEFARTNREELFDLVKANNNNPKIRSIQCKVEPTMFYCSNCHKVKYSNSCDKAPKCSCGHVMQQFPFVYACECGYSRGVFPPDYKANYLFFPASGTKSNYKLKEKRGNQTFDIELRHKCDCGKMLFPRNATDQSVFHPQIGKSVNLISKEEAEIFKKYGEKAEKLVLANWLGYINNEEYKSIINNPKDFFENDLKNDVLEEQIRQFVEQGLTREVAVKILCKGKSCNIDDIISKMESEFEFGDFSPDKLKIAISNLIEFNTIKHPISFIPFEKAVESQIESENIFSENEVKELNKKCGISNIQLSESIQIISYAFGYTRISPTPETQENKLKLKCFSSGQRYNVFTSKLDTEGLLIGFDRAKVFKWLSDNKIINDDIDVNDEIKLKKWFLEHVDVSKISHFSEISSIDLITKAVYSMIHTASHLLIKSAGINSGLHRDSIAEIIFPNIPAIFIYPTSIQGMSLGSISGMFESNYKKFIEDALTNFEICTFDPICKENQNAACMACSMISDVSCEHFNKDISRAYLYGGKIKVDDGDDIIIEKGFWK